MRYVSRHPYQQHVSGKVFNKADDATFIGLAMMWLWKSFKVG
jgi:hypothetical protein